MALSSKFLQDLLTHVPADQRAAVEAALEASPDAVKFADDGAKRQSEFSRAMDQVRAQEQKIKDIHAEQTAWYDANLPLLEAGKKALEGAGSNPSTQPVDLPADLVRAADVEKMVNERERGAVNFITATNMLTLKHYEQFKEILDVSALVNDPDAAKLGLDGVYRKHYGDKLAEVAKTAEDARIEARVQERLAEERKTQHIRPPYPVTGADSSPLDALNGQSPDPTQFSADAAADEYLRLVAGR